MGGGSQPPTPRTGARTSWIVNRRLSQNNRVEASAASASGTKRQGRRVSESWVASLLAQPADQLTRVLAEVDDWQFNAFKLEEASGGRPLSSLAFYLMKRMNIIKMMHLNESKLARFLLRIEEGYLHDIYHCKAHGADVLRSLHVLLTRGDVLRVVLSCTRGQEQQEHCEQRGEAAGALSELQDAAYHSKLLFCYLSAVIHDFEHKGRNNDFLIRTGDRLALLYNDMSPAENHHLAASFLIMSEEQCAFLPPNDKQLKDAMRKFMIEMVLATDMKQHFALCGAFNSKVVATRHQPTRPSDHGSPGADAPPAPAPSPALHIDLHANATPQFGRMSLLCRMSVKAPTPHLPPEKPAAAPPPPPPPARGADASPASPPLSIRRSEDAPPSSNTSDAGQMFARKSMLVEQGLSHAVARLGRPTLSPVGSGVSASVGNASSNETPVSTTSQPLFARASHFVRTSRQSSGWQKAESSSLSHCASVGWAPPPPEWDADTQMIVLKLALKCADLGHLASRKEVHTQWVQRLEEEMFRQGDVERSLGQGVSPLMDRTKGGITKPGAQPGFFNVVALPLFQSFVQVFPAASPMHDNVKANLTLWVVADS